MPRKFPLFAIFMLITFVVGCVPQNVAPTSDLLATVVAGTLSVIQVTPIQPQATDEPFMVTPTVAGVTLSPDQIQQGSNRFVYTASENVNFRVGPGRLFQVSRVLAKGTRLELLGYGADNKWIYVKNDEGIVGWVDGLFVDGSFDGPQPPIIVPEDVITITGNVTNANGPITFVGIALVQGGQFTEGYTDETGNFYIYVPKTLKGDWFLQEYSIDCRSNLMDANCQCLNNSCGSLFPESIKITFPVASNSVNVNFGWE